MANVHKARITRLKKLLRSQGELSALLLSSTPSRKRTRDDIYPYRPDADIFYLTGCTARDAVVLVSASLKEPVILVPPYSEHRLVWEGEPPPYKKIARDAGAQLIVTGEIKKEVMALLSGVERLYYSQDPDGFAREIVQELMNTQRDPRRPLPNSFTNAEVLLEQLRMFKDPSEIKAIQIAGAITNQALFHTIPLMTAGMRETQVAASINFIFAMQGCPPAFATIAATGASAAALHHEPAERRLRKGDMLLIDCGAEYQLYAGDITRTLPIGGRFAPWQRDIYEIVLASQKAAIKTIRHGVRLPAVYAAAAKVLAEGLRELKVLKAPLRQIMDQHLYRKYFPHGIGHGLGMDVHDVGPIRGTVDVTLEQGMVMTVEPGLYFRHAVGKIMPCGVRIEDDVLVEKGGCRVLSEGFPKEVAEVEALFD